MCPSNRRTEIMEKTTSYAKLCESMPGGVSSPVRAAKGMGIEPLIAASGQGATIRDIHGKDYIDFCCSWGALIHGHAHPVVLEAVNRQMQRGTSYGVTTLYE